LLSVSPDGEPDVVTSDPGSGAESGRGASPATVAHEFVFGAGDAESVCLVGNFNRWTVCATPLERTPDGLWRVICELPPGRHEYMFVVDNEWRSDPDAGLYVDDGFGNQNAVLLL
jgi:1,4-alpha-glucan branching enzyme